MWQEHEPGLALPQEGKLKLMRRVHISAEMLLNEPAIVTHTCNPSTASKKRREEC